MENKLIKHINKNVRLYIGPHKPHNYPAQTNPKKIPKIFRRVKNTLGLRLLSDLSELRRKNS